MDRTKGSTYKEWNVYTWYQCEETFRLRKRTLKTSNINKKFQGLGFLTRFLSAMFGREMADDYRSISGRFLVGGRPEPAMAIFSPHVLWWTRSRWPNVYIESVGSFSSASLLAEMLENRSEKISVRLLGVAFRKKLENRSENKSVRLLGVTFCKNSENRSKKKSIRLMGVTFRKK